jgi:ABC-type transporter Mla MlaB component
MTLAAAAPPALPTELTVCTVAEVRRHWLAWLAQAPPDRLRDVAGQCVLDGSKVDQVDAAGVQLLVALANTLRAQQCELRLASPSSPLRDACAILGLQDLLAHDGAGALH